MKKTLTKKKNNKKDTSFHRRTETHSAKLPDLKRRAGPHRVSRSSQPVLGMVGPVQRKLVIGSPNDRYEQEADRVAEQVMRMPDPLVQRQETDEEEELVQTKPLAAQITPLVQRQMVEEEEKEHVQPKPLSAKITPLVQRQVDMEEEELKVSKKSAEVTSTNKIERSPREKRLDKLDQGLEEIDRKIKELENLITQSKERVHGIHKDILKLKRKRIQSQVAAFEPDKPGKSFEQVNREIKNILVECQNLQYWEESEVVSQAITSMAGKLIPVIIKSRNEYLRSKSPDTALNYLKNIERYQFLGGEGFENGHLNEAVELLQSLPKDQQEEMVQRQADAEEKEEESLIQPKGFNVRSTQVQPSLQEKIHSIRGKGQPLPQSERNFFEPRFGQDFSWVRFHTDEGASQTARFLNARAFTFGQDIFFGSGEYRPQTHLGRKLLAHELGHIVQQKSVITPPKIQKQERQSKGITFNPEFDIEMILGPIPENQTASASQDQMLALFKYLKRIRRSSPGLEQLVINILESYFPDFGDQIWAQSKKPFAGYSGTRHKARKRMQEAKRLGLTETARGRWKKRFHGSDILFFSGHHYGSLEFGLPREAGSLDIKDLKTRRKPTVFERVKLIMVSSCSVLRKSELPKFRKRFPNAYILGWHSGAPFRQDNMMKIFLSKLPSDLILEDPTDMGRVLQLWESFVQNLEKEGIKLRSEKWKKRNPWGLGYATPDGKVKYLRRNKKGKWIWRTEMY